MDAPSDKGSQNLKVQHFDPAPTPWYLMSVKCERPLDELTAHVLLLNHHLNFKYCILYVDGMQTGVKMDQPNYQMPLADLSGLGYKTHRDNYWLFLYISHTGLYGDWNIQYFRTVRHRKVH